MKSHRLFVPQSMIPALVSGAKTQHRVPFPHPETSRTMKYAGQLKDGTWMLTDHVPPEKWDSWFPAEYLKGGGVKCPYQPGDEVWVPETWQAVHFTDDDWWHCKGPVPEPIIEDPETPHPPFWAIAYQQDPEADWPEHIDDRGFPWRSPATMPRWAARIVRTVKAVRVERVQDINTDDIVAEGCQWAGDESKFFSRYWDATHGPGAWDRNDWVWVLDLEAKR